MATVTELGLREEYELRDPDTITFGLREEYLVETTHTAVLREEYSLPPATVTFGLREEYEVAVRRTVTRRIAGQWLALERRRWVDGAWDPPL